MKCIILCVFYMLFLYEIINNRENILYLERVLYIIHSMSNLVTNNIQFVTFKISSGFYGIDIMDTDRIINIEKTREIPYAPSYITGFFHMNDEIIPVVSIHERFGLVKPQLTKEEELLSCFIILKMRDVKIAIIIDKIYQVLHVNPENILQPSHLTNTVSSEYITGVVRQTEVVNEEYLIILDISKMFNHTDMHLFRNITTVVA